MNLADSILFVQNKIILNNKYFIRVDYDRFGC